MEFKQTVRVPVAHLYKVLIQSAAYDIQQHSSQEIDDTELKGITYEKSFNQSASAEITITDQIANRSYGFQTVTPKRTFHTLYQLEEMNDKCRVVYQEELTSERKIQQINDLVMSWFMQRSKKKRLSLLFHAIEKEYQEQ
ncbi:DUF3284 domain-containing protein [Jeotgalibaca ciconiae]|uniref:DUF3284 domain-containing protein n=1 Tax=Jeotgalibaca ciconiae TaxID=2496265 RepID=UPI0013DF0621|nr:DUF3284 domain-containing protein [Jeotgalibaca ciconiae]